MNKYNCPKCDSSNDRINDNDFLCNDCGWSFSFINRHHNRIRGNQAFLEFIQKRGVVNEPL